MVNEISINFSAKNGNFDSINKVVNKLTEVNTCPYCVLRFLGLHESNVYRRMKNDELTKWIEGIVNYELTDNFVCCVCLGILQPKYSEDIFISSIYNDVIALGFEFYDFLCSVTLPVCIQVRERALWLFLRKEFKNVFSEEFPKIIVVKDVWKWINGPKLAEKFGVALNQRSTFNIQINFEYPYDGKECNFLLTLKAAFSKRKKMCKNNDILNRLSVQRALDSCDSGWFQKNYTCPPAVPLGILKCQKITCHRESLYLAGRYNKYCRTLSQTPWFIGNEKKFEDSVEELITLPIKKMAQVTDTKFSSSGREDVDVRMLGRGRPFLIELINSKKLHFSSEDCKSLSDEINQSVKIKVNNLQQIEKSCVSLIKEGEESKVKIYRAVCVYKGTLDESLLTKLNETKDIVLQQRTPIRVLHRRPLAVRERTVHTINVTKIGEGQLVVVMSTQAGTYVKEFVHGDFGRTAPSLGDILNVECDIVELDVQDILIDWPPPTHHSITDLSTCDSKLDAPEADHHTSESPTRHSELELSLTLDSKID